MKKIETTLTTQYGNFRIVDYFNNADERAPDFALVRGSVAGASGVLARIQSECLTGHVLKSLSCDCYEQLHDSLTRIAGEDRGILIYLRQEGRGIGLTAKLESYILQRQGADTVDANLQLGHAADERKYDAAAAILNDLEIVSIRLLTNNPAKTEALRSNGIEVSDVLRLPPVVRDENRRYLMTKIERMGHTFEI